jgi:multidrug resistance efflux pump
VRAFVVRMVPEVSGKVVEVAVHDNQIGGTDGLPGRGELGLGTLDGDAERGRVATAGVDEAQAQLVQEIAQRDNVREQAGRVFELVRTGVYASQELKKSRLGRSAPAGRGRGARQRRFPDPDSLFLRPSRISVTLSSLPRRN